MMPNPISFNLRSMKEQEGKSHLTGERVLQTQCLYENPYYYCEVTQRHYEKCGDVRYDIHITPTDTLCLPLFVDYDEDDRETPIRVQLELPFDSVDRLTWQQAEQYLPYLQIAIESAQWLEQEVLSQWIGGL